MYSQTASNNRNINWYWLTQFQQRKLHQCAAGFGTVAELRIHSCQNSFCFTGCQPSAARLSLPKGGAAAGLLASRRSFRDIALCNLFFTAAHRQVKASVSLVSSSCSAHMATAVLQQRARQHCLDLGSVVLRQAAQPDSQLDSFAVRDRESEQLQIGVVD